MGAFVFAALSPWTASAALLLSADGLTVYDTANDITWLADANLPASNRFGIPLCSGAKSQQPCVNGTGSMNYASAAAWVQAMNAANYLGHSNWQLPTTPAGDPTCGRTGPSGGKFGFGCTAGALDSLYNTLGFKAPNTAVPVPNNTVGPFNNFQPYLYWTQTPAGPNQGNATFSFATGWQGANTLPNFLYLLPMIQGKIAGAPPASGDGLQISADKHTVYDPVTNVTWVANANLAATTTFGLPRCTDPTTPMICVAQDGAMTYDSAVQSIANMNAAAYLGQTHWQVPAIEGNCPNYGCGGAQNPMGNLFYNQLGFSQGMAVIPPLNVGVGPFKNLQPYLYWTCGGATIQSACEPDGPVANQEYSYSFGSGFQGTDILPNSLYVTAYFVGARGTTSGPVISQVANAEGESPTIAPNTWIEIKGASLAPAGDSRIWQSTDFTGGLMPTKLDGVSVTVNGKSAYVYYISPSQINVLTPPDAMSGSTQVVVTNNGAASAAFTAQAQALSPSFFVFNGWPYVVAVHTDGTLIGPASLYPGSTTPAKPGETVLLYANGFGQTNAPVASGSVVQSGTLSTLPTITIGGKLAVVQFAGLISPGLFQFNVIVPPALADGDQPLMAEFNGAATQSGLLINIQH
jgi:uncharacterized protein (TIGR03437 family)